MQSKLILTTPALRDGIQTDAIAGALANSTAELEGRIKTNIQSSRPTGHIYRRTPLVRKGSRRNSGLKLKPGNRAGTVIVGYTFHRASSPGQPPAIDTGRLINSIRGMRISDFQHRINVGVEYGLPLDDPAGLDRPFFTSEVEKYRPIFYENMRRAVIGPQL
jgi:hypothetical protein